MPGILTTLTNEERAENNVSPLTENALLDQAAKMKAEDMATRGYFAHTSPDGKTPWYWLNQVGYSYSYAGENLAVNFFESDDVAQAWMNSPSHRENIVKKDYTEIGIGVATGLYEGRDTVFVAQFFGTPIKKALAPAGIVTTVPQNTPNVLTPPASPATPPAVATVPTEVKVLGEEVTNSPIVITGDIKASSGLKSFIQKVLTSPRQYVTYIFGGILSLIILVLLLILFIRSEKAHPVIVARGLGLIAIIVFLLFVNIKVLHLETKVPADGISANVIAD